MSALTVTMIHREEKNIIGTVGGGGGEGMFIRIIVIPH